MPDSILDWIKKQGTDFISRTVIPLFAVDDSPPTLADGEARPGRMNKANGGVVVHVANAADISGGGGGGGEVTQGAGAVANPWYAQGVNGGVGERLATHALQGAGLPAAFTGGGGVKVGIVDAIPAGSNTIGKTDQGAGTGTADGYYTVRVSDGSAFLSPLTDTQLRATPVPVSVSTLPLPSGAATATLQGAGLPASLVDGRLDNNIGAWLGSTTPTVGQKTAAASIPVVLPSDSFISPVTQVPSVSGWTIPATAIPYVGALLHIRSGGSLYPLSGQTDGTLSIQGVNAVGNTNISRPIPCGYIDDATGANIVPRADGTGRARVMIAGAAPHANATLDVYTRFPTLGTANVAFASGIASLKATAGRIRQLQIHYTDATGSGLYVQLHNAATATAPSDSTWVMAWPINATTSVVDFLSQIDIPCSAGIKLAFSTTRLTYTAATTENGAVVGYGA